MFMFLCMLKLVACIQLGSTRLPTEQLGINFGFNLIGLSSARYAYVSVHMINVCIIKNVCIYKIFFIIMYAIIVPVPYLSRSDQSIYLYTLSMHILFVLYTCI